MEEVELEEIEIDDKPPNDIHNINLENNEEKKTSEIKIRENNVIEERNIEKEEEIILSSSPSVVDTYFTKFLRVGWGWKEEVAIIFGVLYIFFGAVVFWELEKNGDDSHVEDDNFSDPFSKPWTLENSIYFCIVSLATIDYALQIERNKIDNGIKGFGDIAPVTRIGRVFFMIYITIGLLIIAFAVGGIAGKVLSLISFARLQLQMVAFGLHRAVKRCIYTSNFVDENESNDIEMNDLSHPLPPAQRKKKSMIRRALHFVTFQTIRFFLSPKSIFGIASTFLFGMLFIVAFIFMWLENRTYLESVFFCFTTMTTIGFGDLVPVTRAGKALVCIFSLLALGMITVLIGEVSAILAYSATQRIESEKERFIIARLDDKVPWGVSDMMTHLKLRTLQLNLSPDDLQSLIEKLKEDMDEYKDEYNLARPLQERIQEKNSLQREELVREKHLSRSISNNSINV